MRFVSMSTWEDNSWSRAIYTCYCVYSLLSLYWKFGKVGTMIIYLTWNIKKVALVVYYSTTTLSCCHVVMILYAPCFFTLVCSSQWEYLYVCLICFVWTCWKNIVMCSFWFRCCWWWCYVIISNLITNSAHSFFYEIENERKPE